MNIAKLIDHTYLEANVTENEIKRICQEAQKYSFRGIAVNSRWTKLAQELLKGIETKVVIPIDYPLGTSSHSIRLVQAQQAKEDGADEIDVVLDIGNFKAGKYDEVLDDLKEIAKVLPTKVIIETGYLTDEEIKKAAELVKESGAFCVKTSTGTFPKVDVDTKVGHVKLIREAVGPGFQIKAAGGIRTKKDLEKILDAGATIIGTSAGVKIITET